MDLTGPAYPGGASSSPITFIAGDGDFRTSGVTLNSFSSNHNGYAQINIEGNPGWYVVKGFNVTGGGPSQKAGIRIANAHNCQVIKCRVSGAFTGIFASLADGI